MYKFRLGVLVFACCAVQVSTYSYAQTYPAKPPRYVVPQSPGSGADIIGRIIATGLTQVWGQQVVVDNRAGASGNIGAEIAARAAADGYTLFQVSAPHATNVSLYAKLPYDLVRDFAPVTLLAAQPHILVVHPSLPVKSVPELVKLAKARPGAINYSSAGTGTTTFIAAELFKIAASVDMLHVPYRGGGESLTAVISGETSVYFPPVPAALAHVRQARLRALAVTTAKRLPLIPEYPTMAEGGLRGFDYSNWHGLLVQAKTPPAIITSIHEAALSVLNDPSVNKRLKDLGYLPVGNMPEEFAQYLMMDIERQGKVIRALGIAAK
jgi:tripartite-type tricarboxylate transporter receptor subunit TctC